MKNIVIYASVHHNNAEKLLKSGCIGLDIDLVNINVIQNIDLSKYSNVGFASGIYYGQFHKSLFAFIDKCQILPKEVFLIHTSGSGNKKSNSSFIKKLQSKGVFASKCFSCKGFDTFGIFKYFKGIAKKHPNDKDIANFKKFIFEITK